MGHRDTLTQGPGPPAGGQNTIPEGRPGFRAGRVTPRRGDLCRSDRHHLLPAANINLPTPRHPRPGGQSFCPAVLSSLIFHDCDDNSAHLRCHGPHNNEPRRFLRARQHWCWETAGARGLHSGRSQGFPQCPCSLVSPCLQNENARAPAWLHGGHMHGICMWHTHANVHGRLQRTGTHTETWLEIQAQQNVHGGT